MKMTVVTATANADNTYKIWKSWRERAALDWPLIIVWNSRHTLPFKGSPALEEGIKHGDAVLIATDYLGTVGAFSVGVNHALQDPEVEIIACLHDDLEILTPRWDYRVVKFFEEPGPGLIGFGGATGLGSGGGAEFGMYAKPFDPMTLARRDFVSNLIDAEKHGRHSTEPEQVAVLDGFSQIFSRQFLTCGLVESNQYAWLAKLGMIHHAYDAALGCLARRYGYDVWYLPIECHHWGGMTAVADAGYQAWAKERNSAGDQGLWINAHVACYQEFRDVLPFSVKGV